MNPPPDYELFEHYEQVARRLADIDALSEAHWLQLMEVDMLRGGTELSDGYVARVAASFQRVCRYGHVGKYSRHGKHKVLRCRECLNATQRRARVKKRANQRFAATGS